MTETVRVSRDELTAGEVLAVLNDGGRVLVEVDILGSSTEAVIREHRGTYYCDTRTKLFKHDTEAGLRECLESNELVLSEAATGESARPVSGGRPG